MDQEKQFVAEGDRPYPTEGKVRIVLPGKRSMGLVLTIFPFVASRAVDVGGYAIFIYFAGLLSELLNFGPNAGNNGLNGALAFASYFFLSILLRAVLALSVIFAAIGLTFFRKTDLDDASLYDPRSGNGSSSEIPDGIKGWNWGAAGMTWVWGTSQGVWVSLVSLIPLGFVGVAIWIVFGLKGSEWAWKSQKWKSVEEFKAYQRKWTVWGIMFFVLSIASLAMSILRKI